MNKKQIIVIIIGVSLLLPYVTWVLDTHEDYRKQKSISETFGDLAIAAITNVKGKSDKDIEQTTKTFSFMWDKYEESKKKIIPMKRKLTLQIMGLLAYISIIGAVIYGTKEKERIIKSS